MDRSYLSGAAGTPPAAPAAPSVGYPQSANPGLGIPATKPGKYWYYMITEELRAVIAAAGITPDMEDVSQLSQAIAELVAAAPNPVGPHTISIPAAALRPRATNGCAPLAVSAGAAGQPDVDYLAFDGDAAEYAKITIPMPKGWNEGMVKAEFQWRRASGTGAADVVWGMRAVAVSDNETPVTNFGSNATVTDDAKTTTANFALSGFTGDCTIGGSPAEGDLVMFEFFRLPADAADTLASVDAWLSSVRLTYTTAAATDA